VNRLAGRLHSLAVLLCKGYRDCQCGSCEYDSERKREARSICLSAWWHMYSSCRCNRGQCWIMLADESRPGRDYSAHTSSRAGYCQEICRPKTKERPKVAHFRLRQGDLTSTCFYRIDNVGPAKYYCNCCRCCDCVRVCGDSVQWKLHERVLY
jgi:hypothetical protein